MDLTAFPGGDLVQEGLSDLARGAETIPALLVSIGAPRLRRIGLPVPNALVRRLVSFENAAECAGL